MFKDKIKESSFSVIPIVLIVLALSFTIVDISTNDLISFLIGAVLIIFGLAIFLFGAEMGVEEIGNHLGVFVANFKSLILIILSGLFLGFLITVAEPDLMILGFQIENVTNGVLTKNLIVISVSAGVGIMLALGFYRILKEIPITKTFTFLYGAIFILLIFSMEEFTGIAFDASGATTGAMTTPFILAIGLGVSKMKGSEKSAEDSFGLLGICSAGPIFAVIMLGLFTGHVAGGEITEVATVSGLANYLIEFKHAAKDTAIAIVPVAVLFIVTNKFFFKLRKREYRRILKGLGYTFIGLVLFMGGVNSGFMSVARQIGSSIAVTNYKLLPVIGFFLGMVVVLAEPAVYILSHQVEDVTAGSIPRKMIVVALSIGVALAVCLSMIRILSSSIKLWMFLVPGFSIAMILSYFIPNIFVGIAFDSGGVASGPMTATFLLAFSQGASAMIEGADILIDGFGIIAMVAMMPIISISILGLLFKIKSKKEGIDVD